MSKKKIILNYASLNCNSLIKSHSSAVQSSYIRYLRQQRYDIMALQETHAIPSSQESLDSMFQAQQTIWTPHCGIVSFSADYILTAVDTSAYFTSERFILCKVEHPHQFYEPFYILNVYAPASSNNERRVFFENVYNMLLDLTDSVPTGRLIISGDFNYDYHRDIVPGTGRYKTHDMWVFYLDAYFYNCLHLNDLHQVPTFQRNTAIHSCIDYVFAGDQIQHCLEESSLSYLQPNWSDHALLHCTFTLGTSKQGPGLFRGIQHMLITPSSGNN